MKPEQYFKDYPGKKECFQTSDGLIFHEKGDAHMHGDHLKDTEVTKFKSGKKTELNEAADAELTAEEIALAKEVADKKNADKEAKAKADADKKAADKLVADQKAADKLVAGQKAADKKAADKLAADKKAAFEKAEKDGK